MKLTTSFFNISAALVRENLRRFWAVPAFGFIGYFFTGIFPILIADPEGQARYYTLRSILSFHHPAFVFFYCLFPLIAAVVLMRYMFAPGSVTVMHSLPFTRDRLFNSNFISGLLLVWAPLVATGILCLIMRGLALGDVLYDEVSVSRICACFALMLLLTFFVYAVCVLAGVVCGNTPMHIIMCGLLNGVLPAVAAIGYVYCELFLFGFYDSNEMLMSITALSPALYLPVTGGAPGAVAVTAYIVFGLLIYASANMIYARKPLERAGDSITFALMEWVVCFFAALAGMTLTAVYFASLEGETLDAENANFYVGMVVGAVVAFAIARIIVKKSPRILNRETGLQFGAFALVALLLFLGLRFDLYGYERRVPAAGAVESVTVAPDVPGRDRIILPSAYSNAGFYTFSDAESIEAVTALHGDIVENRAALRHMERRLPHSALSLSYETSKPGTSVNRRWSLPTDFCLNNEDMRALLESNEFREQNSFKNPKLGAITNISLMSGRGDDAYIALSSDEFAGITAALDEDLRGQTYEQLFDLTTPVAMLDVWFAAPRGEASGDSGLPSPEAERWLSLAVPKSFENTIAWLSERGYYDRLTAWRESVRSIRLSLCKDVSSPNGFGFMTHEEEIAVFDDPELIEAVMEMGESTPRDYGEYYVVNMSVLRVPDDFSQEYRGMEFVYLNRGNPALDMLLDAANK